ncbi:LuxR C-terminal-related transcriptional regulator [Hydrogenophaga bisanensis]|uniref:LuxR C-terminal-related transcriptional regulator n=1 Tax=Hydrogenophaga bisanensis TaxID=439611 RepID=A0ABW2RDT9_9BURK
MNMLDLSSSAEANRGSTGADDFEAEHLNDLLGSLSHIHALGIVVLGPDDGDREAGRVLYASHPARFRTVGQLLAESDDYGRAWRDALSPAAAYVNLSNHADEGKPWTRRCAEAGVLSFVRVDLATSMDCGYEVFVFMGTEQSNRQAAAEVTYAVMGLSPVLRMALPHIKLEITDRERAVLRAGAEGLTAKETADRLKTTERTVIYYWDRIQSKLNARNKGAALIRAATYGLL